ncbi:MAG: class I SAM-dependent methyltransferase [Marinagarivorans sp.]|nr:class I SAM-dependent methyltransferase [Marinagarivorans sp.]
MNTLKVSCNHPTKQALAEQTAAQLGTALEDTPAQHFYTLNFDEDAVRLHSHSGDKNLPILVELHTGEADYRRKHGGGKNQMIAKAVGISANFKPRVLDATAGLGGDAFVLASLGCSMSLQERSPVAHALLADGLARGYRFACEQGDGELMATFARMTLTQVSSHNLDVANCDVIYLDPMFPLRKKSAAVNKNMRAFHDLIGNDDDADALLAHALKQAVYRVVVKRPRIAPHINNTKPSYMLEGKSSRFDVYTLKKLPQ